MNLESQVQCFENYLDLVNLTYYGQHAGFTSSKKVDSKLPKEVTHSPEELRMKQKSEQKPSDQNLTLTESFISEE